MPSAVPNTQRRQLDPVNLKQLPRLVPRKKQAPPSNPLPVPQTPLLPAPTDQSSFEFTKPTRRILSPEDHKLFLGSPTCDLVLAFTFSVSESVSGKKISDVAHEPHDPIVDKVLYVLDQVEDLIRQHPPEDQGGSRFGNPAFRRFCDQLSSASLDWHEKLFEQRTGTSSVPPAQRIAATEEVATYLQHSFGNRARIDYGSGHELNFIIWLLCLNRLALLPPSTFPALALLVFPRYVKLLRHLQSTYYLEPAGSHGVWGLDDYQFLPFLFGAAQLQHHPYIRPLSIHNELVLDEEGDEYFYLDMVRFTMASKTVKGLKWTQPMLDDISGAKSWEKVEQGMRRMFVKEVLGKLPIMQHFLFGSLVPAVAGMSREEDIMLSEEQEHADLESAERPHPGGHHHQDDDAWGECCGIRIPSTVAASQEMAKRSTQQAFRRVPFD